MSNYWYDRQLETQNKIANKTIYQTEKQLKKYYKKAMKRVIEDFEATFDKLLATVAKDKEPTPADLYKLDKYWQMQSQLKKELQKLGDKEVALLSKQFEDEWRDIYESISLPSGDAFSTISTDNAYQMINQVWLADGKRFSDRIWNNVDNLIETLNEELMDCVITGRSTSKLKEKLINRFNVSYNRANTLVRTEVANIQTQAAARRYQDYGLTKYKYLADTDERTCTHENNGSRNCEDLDGKIFMYSEMRAGVNAPPMHPNCRCAIVPVVD